MGQLVGLESMFLDLRAVFESAAAERTLVLLLRIAVRVDHVLGKVPLLDKAFATEITEEWLVATVQMLVPFHAAAHRKPLSTSLTCPWLLARML